MIRQKLLSTSHPVIILFLGLLIAQILATIQVYLSNLNLYNTLSAVNSAAYLAIPNKQIMSSLPDFRPAFYGGLFFTFTIGAGICLCTMAAAWLWVGAFLQNKFIFFLFLTVWGGFLFLVNRSGLNIIPTLYFLLIVPAVFSLTAYRESKAEARPNRIKRLVHLTPVPILALLWFTQFDGEMFLDLRDNLLLTNCYVRKFSNFYYDYTLYPAEAFKALSQKTIKTCSLQNIKNRSVRQRVGQRLLANDYLPLSAGSDVDLDIYRAGDNLVFQADDRQILQIPLAQFLSEPHKTLRSYSEKIDRYAPFRQFTFLFLLIGFPVMIYMVLHAVFYYAGIFILGRSNTAVAASIMCLLIGIVVFVYFKSNRSRSIRIQNISVALQSDHWQLRAAALKMIAQKRLEIANYASYPVLLKNPTSQERYWLVKTLAFSRRPETFKDLLKFLNDDDLNVRTMAFRALGLRKNPRAIRPILSKIEKSDHWYDQMHAYKSLRSLGWKQTRSP
ncbi:MAG: HEAT repeat domain-containing protein [Deltaproteobacteria bacterium]|jgi:Ca2+/Na+ antiporter|nr:HEAT repeat domain-containing protein [Deltaproteobacteria bacterium]